MKMRLRLALLCCMAVVLAACSTPSGHVSAQYDLGGSGKPPALSSALPVVAVADIQASAWLESPRMIYRLGYADGRQVHAYANSRWTMRPAQLLGQRLKSRMAQAGSVVLSSGAGAAGLPLLKIELEDFTQTFESTSQSHAQLTARVTLLKENRLVAQKTFTQREPAATPDAPGGVAAMALAADGLIDDIARWLVAQASR